MPKCHICKNQRIYQKYIINEFRYYECSVCKSLCLCPVPSIKKIKKYYQSKFEYTAGKVNESNTRNRSNNILDNLQSLNTKGQSLLDIGSGFGFFVEESLKRLNHAIGIEPSNKLYLESSKRIGKNRILNLDFERYVKKYSKNTFDFITLIHVIEHIPDPIKFINDISSLLNKGGILYIETPNYDSWLSKSEQENYTFLTPPDHIWLFSSIPFKQLTGITRLKMIKESTYSYPEHFIGIIKRSLRIISNKSQNNTKLHTSNTNISHKPISKILKYYLFDKIIAPLCVPLINIRNKGSIMELYFRKIHDQ